MVSNKVLVGVATGQHVRRPDFYDYLMLLDRPENTYEIRCHDRSPAKGRNLLINKAKEVNATHLLLVDDDMAFKPDSLKKLLAHDKDIVSGLYLSQAYPHAPVVFDIAAEDGAALPMYLITEPGLYPIVAAGFGFLLIKMSVFDKLQEPYVRLGELSSENWCDDIGFFKRVREAGIQSYCDTSVQIGHMGTMVIWPNFVNGKWYSGYDTAGSGIINTPQFDDGSGYEFRTSKDESVGVGV